MQREVEGPWPAQDSPPSPRGLQTRSRAFPSKRKHRPRCSRRSGRHKLYLRLSPPCASQGDVSSHGPLLNVIQFVLFPLKLVLPASPFRSRFCERFRTVPSPFAAPTSSRSSGPQHAQTSQISLPLRPEPHLQPETFSLCCLSAISASQRSICRGREIPRGCVTWQHAQENLGSGSESDPPCPNLW